MMRHARPTKPFRIALLTREYVTDHPTGGGLASYLARLADAFRQQGHEPEVFTIGDQPRLTWHNGVRVETVRPAENLPLRLIGAHWRPRLALGGTLTQLRGALALSQALESRHAVKPFSAVQSSDWGLVGYYVRSTPQRTHLVRCSWSRPLYQQHSGAANTLDHRMLSRLERQCLSKADFAYAPSQFIADDLSTRHGLDVRVIRPPLGPLHTNAANLPDLPPRYMVHFGQLSSLKGTDVVLDAVKLARQEEPRLHIVLAGRPLDPKLTARIASAPGITHVGPLARPTLFALVQRAVAAVLPSRCDNLPNTAIESLSLGVPVIGSAGASIDELVTDGHTGRLAPIGDASALADAMLELWRRPMHVAPDDLSAHSTWSNMQPRIAVQAIINAATISDCRRLAA